MEKKIVPAPLSADLQGRDPIACIANFYIDRKKNAFEIFLELFIAAHEAKHKAYCPYSNFRVGAALLTSTGKIYSGCNIENASYALATCAERTAIVKAVSEGEMSFKQIAITSDVETGFTGPCGSCRQTLAEFGLDLDVYLVNPKNESECYTLRDLLPKAFTPRDLQKSRASHDIVE